MSEPNYQHIIDHYEACLARHGDSHLGVDWPRLEDARRRYGVMLDLIPAHEPGPLSLLDFGCGAAHLFGYMQETGADARIRYAGLDVSDKFVALARSKFPDNVYYVGDVLESDLALPAFDYIVLNGVFTVKREMSFEAMWAYTQQLLRVLYPLARRGLAFNAMVKHVDWERDDLFHLPMDLLADFLKRELSRHFVMRADYGLYDYTTYVYREPTGPNA